MKRILCFIENLGSGGAERQLTGLAVMLKQQGHEVEVCYYVKKEFYLPDLLDAGVNVKYLSDALSFNKRFASIRRHIREYKPDTIISYTPSTSMMTCILKRLGGRFNLIVSERNTTQSLTIKEKFKLFCYRWANYIVPNSFAQADFIKRVSPHLADKIKVITNFVDTDRFSPSNEIVPVHEELRVLCVGRMMPQKNIIRFIKVISILVSKGYNLRVDWFGQDLKDAYSKECHNAISEYALEQRFVFQAPSSEIQVQYHRADVFCLPSIYEGFPNVLCEAMSCGKPVLSCRVSDTPNIVQEGANGLLFDPTSIDDMVMAFEKYIAMPNLRHNEMGKISREISLGLFSREKFLANYSSII